MTAKAAMTINTVMFASKTNFIKLIAGLLFISIISFIASLKFGSVELTWAQIMSAFSTTQQHLIVELRINRSINAFSVGVLLSLAGVMMQVLLRNPLADPYILGISGGASIGALIAIMLNFSLFGLNLSAFIGAIISILIVFQWGLKTTQSSVKLILLGVILSLTYGAIIKLILVLSENDQLKSMIFWLMGDLSSIHFNYLTLITACLVLCLSLMLANRMNLLMLGRQKSQTLGLPLNQTYLILYLLASIATAIAITTSGVIGFVGLIIPHSLRFLRITDHRLLIPASALVGGVFLMLADTLSRSLFVPIQLPVGLITTLIGAPIFIYLLRK